MGASELLSPAIWTSHHILHRTHEIAKDSATRLRAFHHCPRRLMPIWDTHLDSYSETAPTAQRSHQLFRAPFFGTWHVCELVKFNKHTVSSLSSCRYQAAGMGASCSCFEAAAMHGRWHTEVSIPLDMQSKMCATDSTESTSKLDSLSVRCKLLKLQERDAHWFCMFSQNCMQGSFWSQLPVRTACETKHAAAIPEEQQP